MQTLVQYRQIGTVRKLLADYFRDREPFAIIDQAVVSGVNFLTTVMIARASGPAQYGVFALAWMGVLFFNSLQMALIIAPMMSIGPKQSHDDAPGYFGSVLLQELCFAGCSGALMYIGIGIAADRVHGLEVDRLSLPLSLATSAYLLQDFIRRYLFTTKKIALGLLTDAVSYLSQLPFLWFMYRAGSLTNSAALWVIGWTTVAGIVVGLFCLDSVEFRLYAFSKVARRHWPMSRWLLPSAVLQFTMVNLSVIVAPAYYGAAAAGALRAAQNIAAIANVWFLGLDNIVPAEAARRLKRYGLPAMLGYLRQVLIRWGAVTLFFVVAVCCAPNFWLRLLYGSKYAGFGYLVVLFGMFILMVFLSIPLRATLQALEYTSPILWSCVITTVFSAALAVPFAKMLGLTGLMIGMIGAQFVCQTVQAVALVVRVRSAKKGETLGLAIPHEALMNES